jgi:hypothetical protein
MTGFEEIIHFIISLDDTYLKLSIIYSKYDETMVSWHDRFEFLALARIYDTPLRWDFH